MRGLRRELGLGSTTAAVIGGIIAVCILRTPADMAKALGLPCDRLLAGSFGIDGKFEQIIS
jgi:hypothetical protein